MKKHRVRKIVLLLAIAMLGSCGGAIVVPPGLNSKLINISINDTAGSTVVTIQTSNLPQYATFVAQSPPSITLDLASTNASGISKRLNIKNGFVKKINVNQLGVSTGYSSRIVVTLERPLPYSVATNGNTIVLDITKSEQQMPALLPPVKPGQTVTTQLPEGMSPTMSTVPELLSPEAMAASPTTGPEALVPMGAGMSTTTAPEVAEQPMTAEQLSPSVSQQPMAPENTQTGTENAAPVVAPQPPTVASSSEIAQQTEAQAPAEAAPPAEEEHKQSEQIAMLTPAPAVATPVKAMRIRKDIIITSVPLVFKSNQAVLSEDAEASLRDVADYLLEHKDIRLIVAGYSDANGSESYNKELSFYRATWVKLVLEKNGVPSRQILLKPMGETTKFGRSKSTYLQNRRVVLKIVK